MMAATVHQRSSRKADPYVELEFYLARAQKDIGDAFEHVQLVGDDGFADNYWRKLRGLCRMTTTANVGDEVVSVGGHRGRSSTTALRCSRRPPQPPSDLLPRPPLPPPSTLPLASRAVPPVPPTRIDSIRSCRRRSDRMHRRSSSLPPSVEAVCDVDSLSMFVDALLKEVDAMASEPDVGVVDPPTMPITPTSAEPARGSDCYPHHKRNCDLKELLRHVASPHDDDDFDCGQRQFYEDDNCDAATQTSPLAASSPSSSTAASDRWNSTSSSSSSSSSLDSDYACSDPDSESTSNDVSVGVKIKAASDSTTKTTNSQVVDSATNRPSPPSSSSAPCGSEWLRGDGSNGKDGDDDDEPLTPDRWVSVWLEVNKSSSAPILDSRAGDSADVEQRSRGGPGGGGGLGAAGIGGQSITLDYSTSSSMPSKNRSQSAKQLTELEAVEACKWLRAAGFPQYAQMFEDMQFPIDVSSVQKDHYFLDRDSIQSLFRRLNALNRCARMRLDNVPRKISASAEDSDEENQCALSENWKFQRQSRRWSRIPGNFDAAILAAASAAQRTKEDFESHVDGDIDAETTATKTTSATEDVAGIPATEVFASEPVGNGNAHADNNGNGNNGASDTGLQRTGSDRLKDGAKALLRRVESLKTRRSRKKNREAVVISGPQLLDVPLLSDDATATSTSTAVTVASPQRIQWALVTTTAATAAVGASVTPAPTSCSSGSPGSSNSLSDVSQHSTPPSVHGLALCSSGSGGGGGQCFFGAAMTRRRRGGGEHDSYALSDSECSPTLWRGGSSSPTTAAATTTIHQYLRPTDSPQQFAEGGRSSRMLLFPGDAGCVACSMDADDDDCGINYRTGSFNLGRKESLGFLERLAAKSDGAKLHQQQRVMRASPPVRKCSTIDDAAVREDMQDRDQDVDRHSLYDNVPIVIFDRGYTDEHGEPLHETDIFKNITDLNVAFTGSTAANESTSVTGGRGAPFGFGEKIGEESSSTSTTTELASSGTDEAGDTGSLTSSTTTAAATAAALQSRTMSLAGERRDSGVGLSISRSTSRESAVQPQPCQTRWQVSSQCHRPSIPCRSLPLNGLSSGQMIVLRKLALLKLTALMERYCPSNRTGWNWAMPKFIKRMKMPDYRDKAVFGVPLTVVLQRTGQSIPASIQAAIRHLRKNAIESVGLFRKSGVRSRIQKLKNQCESSGSGSDVSRLASMYEDQQPYDVADMIKQYFRELPEALLTNKMSETFIGIYQHVDEDMRLEALQAALILMPDENREVLQALLSFLNDVSSKADENQMTASNLAVCFAPSLFHMSSPRRSHSTSPRRRKTVGAPDQRELNETRAAHECLAHMIREFHKIFCIPEDILVQCRCPEFELGEAPTVDELFRQRMTGDGSTSTSAWNVMVDAAVQWVFKESREKFKSGWISSSSSPTTGGLQSSAAAAAAFATDAFTDVAFKKLGDGNPLRIWKVAVDVEAPPVELLNRILRERHLWDADLLKWRVIDRLDKQTEIFQYVTKSMTPLPPRDFCVLRSWRTDFPKGTCVLVEMSVDHGDATPLVNGVRANVLTSTYLIEPCGSGKSRVTHVSRVDTRGRSSEWYNKVYGHLCSIFIAQLRDSLQHTAEGPESKV